LTSSDHGGRDDDPGAALADLSDIP